MLLYGLYHSFSLANSPGHGFFTPYILTMPCRIRAHDSMPMWRGGNMNDVYFRKLDQFPVICEGFDTISKHIKGNFYMALVYITDGYSFGTGIFKMVSSHTSYTNDPLGQVITGLSL